MRCVTLATAIHDPRPYTGRLVSRGFPNQHIGGRDASNPLITWEGSPCASNFLRRTLLGSLLTVSLAGVSSTAQAATQEAGTVPADTRDDHNGFDEGLLGLVGLAGLLGLRRRDNRDVPRTNRI